MCTILDEVPLSSFRASFRSVFRQLQRGKGFEKITYYDGHYLLSGDVTGYYAWTKVASPYWLGQVLKNGEIPFFNYRVGSCETILRAITLMGMNVERLGRTIARSDRAVFSNIVKDHCSLKK